MSLGKTIRDIRIQKSITQDVLAEKVGTSQVHIYRIEKGEVRNPKLELLEKIARELSINVKTLLDAKNSEYSAGESFESVFTKLQLLAPVPVPVVADLHNPGAIMEYRYIAKEKATSQNLVGVMCSGWSLESEDIREGDILIIDRDAKPEPGKVILCYRDNVEKPRLLRFTYAEDINNCDIYGVVIEINRKL